VSAQLSEGEYKIVGVLSGKILEVEEERRMMIGPGLPSGGVMTSLISVFG
jgi:hypothetical protein